MKLFISFMPKKSMIELFTYSIQSKKTIEEITSKVEESCQKNGFTLVHQYAYHEVVATKGFPIDRKVYIYEICQAKLASMMLTTNPYFSPFMPCRIAVYQNDECCTIATQNMEMMLGLIKNQKELYQEATTLFHSLKKMMHELK
jgi:uncharacterized protein (DUF302 family)